MHNINHGAKNKKQGDKKKWRRDATTVRAGVGGDWGLQLKSLSNFLHLVLPRTRKNLEKIAW